MRGKGKKKVNYLGCLAQTLLALYAYFDFFDLPILSIHYFELF
jgi:hypothetical protein